VRPLRRPSGRIFPAGFLFVFFLLTFASSCPALPASFSAREELKRAERAAGDKEWDEAERIYYRVLERAQVEDRIAAWRGLSGLYQKLHYHKKYKEAAAGLEADENFLRSLVPEADFYYTNERVGKGESYSRIASQRSVSVEWLVRANRAKPLRAGAAIRVPRIRYLLEISKAGKTLTWKRGAEVLKVYSIAVGREVTGTPAGQFRIINKVADPVWYRLGEQYPPGSPKNLLGTRWMGLDRKGYGIHGTREPWTIGRAASHGCIRMHNRDVEELFRWVPIGTEVIIQ
jgi:lipoprotein-anchoring transpeptidase ErfK/SrfK